MAAISREKILFGAALALAAASGALFGGLAWRNTRLPQGPVASAQMPAAAYAATVADAPTVKTRPWNPPVAQSRGRDWIYDMFTPPEIFYNPRSQLFTVKPPPSGTDEAPEEAFGLELIGVRPEPFRLQLIGYVGSEGNWSGTFQNLVSGEVFLAAAGRRVADLALTIRRLEVRNESVALAESMTTRQRVATAVVHDERTGRDLTLTHRERQFTGGLTALVAAPGETAARELRQGETVKLGEASYHIEKIQLAPPRIDVTKESPSLIQPDRRTLAPRETEDATPPVT
jgi:hypothetical protein